jgi:hypothetical protein
MKLILKQIVNEAQEIVPDALRAQESHDWINQ